MAKLHNTIYKGLDNPVLFDISALPSFTRIELVLGGETYDTAATPNNLFVDGIYLNLSIGTVTALADGGYVPEIKGYSATYNDGYLIASKKTGQLPAIVVLSI